MQLDEELKEKLIELIQEGKPIPFEYKNLLFPPDEVQGEYELVYKEKKKKEDILADMMSVPFQVAKKCGSVRNGEWHNAMNLVRHHPSASVGRVSKFDFCPHHRQVAERGGIYD